MRGVVSDGLKKGVGGGAAKSAGVSPSFRYSNNITEWIGCYETTEGKTGFATGFLQIL